MKLWMLPWLLPVGLLACIASISLIRPLGLAVAGLIAWVVIPVVGLHIRARAGLDKGDDDVDYWRFNRFWS
jgi:hypothetical protein